MLLPSPLPATPSEGKIRFGYSFYSLNFYIFSFGVFETNCFKPSPRLPPSLSLVQGSGALSLRPRVQDGRLGPGCLAPAQLVPGPLGHTGSTSWAKVFPVLSCNPRARPSDSEVSVIDPSLPI